MFNYVGFNLLSLLWELLLIKESITITTSSTLLPVMFTLDLKGKLCGYWLLRILESSLVGEALKDITPLKEALILFSPKKSSLIAILAKRLAIIAASEELPTILSLFQEFIAAPSIPLVQLIKGTLP